MTVFLDSNVVMDWLSNRPTGFPVEASALMKACETKSVHGYTSSSTLYLAAYVLDKSGRTKADIRNRLRDVLTLVTIASQHNLTFVKRLDFDLNDIEDAFQLSTALHVPDCSVFITANTRDYPKKVKGLKIVHTKDFSVPGPLRL